LWWHSNSGGVGVAAFGAIFGLFGAILGLLNSPYFEASSRPALLLLVSVFIGLDLLIDLTGNIDNAAHIAGLLAGLLCATVLRLFFVKNN
jgi:rhomboid protease GluP